MRFSHWLKVNLNQDILKWLFGIPIRRSWLNDTPPSSSSCLFVPPVFELLHPAVPPPSTVERVNIPGPDFIRTLENGM